ncbi:MAG: hypothetical protein PHX83_11980 [Acidobacteriia bacterium]|nr:hypothetical protein [Terriglobia bacterium]
MKWYVAVSLVVIACLSFFTAMYFFNPRVIEHSSVVSIIQNMPPQKIVAFKAGPPDTVYQEITPKDTQIVSLKNFRATLWADGEQELIGVESNVAVWASVPVNQIGDTLKFTFNKEAIVKKLTPPAEKPKTKYWNGFLTGVAVTALTTTVLLLSTQ